jgi:hypothetical protein
VRTCPARRLQLVEEQEHLPEGMGKVFFFFPRMLM